MSEVPLHQVQAFRVEKFVTFFIRALKYLSKPYTQHRKLFSDINPEPETRNRPIHKFRNEIKFRNEDKYARMMVLVNVPYY